MVNVISDAIRGFDAVGDAVGYAIIKHLNVVAGALRGVTLINTISVGA